MDELMIVIGTMLGVVALSFGMALVESVFVWLLWNWLMPGIFGLPGITIWQAFGLAFLCGLLFGRRGIGRRED